MPLKVNELIDERYTVLGSIGHGGSADVYLATDIITKKAVAIKIMKDELSSDDFNIKSFEIEAAIAASLNHPNIVKILNHGIKDGKPFIVQEFVKGQTLKDVLDRRAPLPFDEVVSIMIQLNDALSNAHFHGIIHRDVKPQNIFYLSDGSIKIGDFGISEAKKIKGFKRNKKTILGSVHYLAPEIVKGKPATVASDIYAAGVTMYELITGKIPFDEKNAVDIAAAHVKKPFPSPKDFVPSCPSELERIIFQATQKKPKKRYKNAEEFKRDLIALQENPTLLKEKKGLLSRIFGFK